MEFIVTKISDDELQHHGILGMRWGRRRYQNKDGSLTEKGKKRYNKETAELKAEKRTLRNKLRVKKKEENLNKLKSERDALQKAVDEGETPEAKKERLMKSTNAKEIYENRGLFTTAELNDRINRMDTETRLAGKVAEQQKQTGLDHVNKAMNKASNTINNATNMFQKVDNAYSTISKSSIGKALAKKLGLELPKKDFDIEDFWNNRSKKNAQQMQDAAKWASSAKIIENYVNDHQKKKSKSDNTSSDANQNDSSNNASKKSDNNSSNSKTETTSKTETYTGPVEGTGTNSSKNSKNNSKYTQTAKDIVDAVWKDVTDDVSNSQKKNYAAIGQRRISGYLPYYK